MPKLGGKRLQVTLGKVRDMHKIFLSELEPGSRDEEPAEEHEDE